MLKTATLVVAHDEDMIKVSVVADPDDGTIKLMVVDDEGQDWTIGWLAFVDDKIVFVRLGGLDGDLFGVDKGGHIDTPMLDSLND